MKLYTYARSSAAYRVRIALNLKNIPHELVAVNLLKREHQSPQYRAINAAGLVPALELDDGRRLTQSSAILHWLDSEFPEPPLLPSDPFERARINGWAQIVACEIHPLNNIAALNFLKQELAVEPEQVNETWYHHWLERGFGALEAELIAAPYSAGEALSLADLFIVPQVYNALRFNFDMNPYPKVNGVWEACNRLPAFIKAFPENQPDFV